MAAKPPQLDGDEIAAAITNLSREPFRGVLSRLIEAEPDVKDVLEFAKKYPDRWAQSLAIVGRLSGFTEKLEVETNIAVNITHMSDSQLVSEIDELEHQIKALDDPKN